MTMIRCYALALVCLMLAIPFASSADTGSVIGKWVVQAETPQGPMQMGFDMKMEGAQLVGTVAAFDSQIPMSALKFEESQLSMQINVMGGDFKLSGTVKDSKMTGTWEQIGGEMKGTWTAEREGFVPSAAAPSAAGIDGIWNSVAVTPDGDLQFVVELKSSGSEVEGKITAGGTIIAIAKGKFADMKVSFELEYSGGTYRIDATLAGDNLTGKWSAVDGTDSGAWSADRSKP